MARERMPDGRWTECVSRDRWQCQAIPLGFHSPERECSYGLVVHHRRLRLQGGTHDLSNLMTLCDLHHKIAHDQDRKGAEACGIILRASAE